MKKRHLAFYKKINADNKSRLGYTTMVHLTPFLTIKGIMNNEPHRLQFLTKVFSTGVILILTSVLNFAQAENYQATTLHGRIVYQGQIPPPQTKIIEEDQETCGENRRMRPITVDSSGGLMEVVVSVEGVKKPTMTANRDDLIISNDECRFQPHMAVGLVKQSLKVENFDPILHNTHIRTKTRAFFNVVLLPQSKGVKKVLRRPGLLTISCNKHPFMIGFVHVFDHPYHAITDKNGAFSISNLPAGTHRLTMWHQYLGTIHQTITLPQKNNTILSIKFPAP